MHTPRHIIIWTEFHNNYRTVLTCLGSDSGEPDAGCRTIREERWFPVFCHQHEVWHQCCPRMSLTKCKYTMCATKSVLCNFKDVCFACTIPIRKSVHVTCKEQAITCMQSHHPICTVLRRDYAHPNCMLQSSYRWDGLNFENSRFASKLSSPRCLPRNYAHSWRNYTHEETKSFLSASEACQLLKYNEFININAWIK